MSKPVLYGIALGCIWGSSFPISQIGVTALGAFPFRLMTVLVSTLCLLIFSYTQVKTYLPQLSANHYIKLFILSIPNIFIVPLINNISLAYLSITTATILIYLMPCFVSILTIALSKALNLSSLIAIGCCSTGVIILSGINAFGLGEYLMILNAFIWASGAIMSQKISFNEIPLSVTVNVQMIFTLILTTITVLIWGITNNISLYPMLTNFTYTSIASVIYIGTIGSAFVYYLWFSLIDMKSAEFTSYATLLSPLISILTAIIIFKEEVNDATITGGILILMSSFVIILKPLLFNKIKLYLEKTG